MPASCVAHASGACLSSCSQSSSPLGARASVLGRAAKWHGRRMFSSSLVRPSPVHDNTNLPLPSSHPSISPIHPSVGSSSSSSLHNPLTLSLSASSFAYGPANGLPRGRLAWHGWVDRIEALMEGKRHWVGRLLACGTIESHKPYIVPYHTVPAQECAYYGGLNHVCLSYREEQAKEMGPASARLTRRSREQTMRTNRPAVGKP